MCATSPISKGVNIAHRICSCRAGWVSRYLRVMERTKRLTRPRRAQTWASWVMDTSVALGRVEESNGAILECFGQGAWRLWVDTGSESVPSRPTKVRKGS